MDLSRLFGAPEKIAGLEVSPGVLRVLLFEKVREGIRVLGASEFPLPRGVITDEGVQDERALAASLTKLFKGAKPRAITTSSVIVTIDDGQVYARTFSFPDLSQEEINDSLALNAPTTVPFPYADSYTDWEEIRSPHATGRKEIFFAQARRHVVDGYLRALGAARLIPVALESRVLSLARILEQPPEPTVFIMGRGASQFILFVIADGNIRFVGKETLPLAPFKSSTGSPGTREPPRVASLLATRVRHTSLYCQMQKGEPIAHVRLGGAIDDLKPLTQELEELLAPLGITVDVAHSRIPLSGIGGVGEGEQSWFPVVGASLRGLVPREEDTIPSLLPVGTEEAYEERRILDFSHVWADLLSILAGVTLLLFLSVFLFINVLGQGIDRSLAVQGNFPVSPDDKKLEAEAKAFNERVALLTQLESRRTLLSPILAELAHTVPPGVSISGLAIGSALGPVSLAGVARTRDSLLQFKGNLEESPHVASLELPLQALSQRENLSFSMTVNLKP